MKNKSKFSRDLVRTIESLSNLRVDEDKVGYFAGQFDDTLKVIENLDDLDTNDILPTNHVTGLTNVFRDDKIEKEKVLKQKDALAGSRNIYNGYFVVKAIFDEK